MTSRSGSGSSAIAVSSVSDFSASWTSSSTAGVSIASRSPKAVSPSSPTGLADLDHVLEREVCGRGDLLVRRLMPELGRQLTLDAPDLARALRDVDREPDGAAGVLQAALDRLADPERRVRREAEALTPV